MKVFQLLFHVLLVVCVAGRALNQATALSLDRPQTASGVSPHELLLHKFTSAGPQVLRLSPRAPDPNAIYFKAECSGEKLWSAMLAEADTVGRYINPTTSVFDGNMVADFGAWGWNELGAQWKACNFQTDFHKNAALVALGIDPRSADVGGPNQCFYLVHKDGPAVLREPSGALPPPAKQFYIDPRGGGALRSTDAMAEIAINPGSGVIFFQRRVAPASAAQRLWTDRLNTPITQQELPLLRSSSDIAWGLWNRAHAPGSNLQNIKYFMACDISNLETSAIIEIAFQKLKRSNPNGPDEPQAWPGTTFEVDGDGPGMALMGSPNGVGVGYFLAQHKAQLGDKYISKITVFDGDLGEPNMLFHVEDAPDDDEEMEDTQSDQGSLGNGINGHVKSEFVTRSEDGKQILREHVFRAKL